MTTCARVYPQVTSALDAYLPAPLEELLAEDANLQSTATVQPAIFAFEVAVARYWTHLLGGLPAVVIGHSLGEVAAAHLVGVMSLDVAARVITARARGMEELPVGAMAAVGCDEVAAAKLVGDVPGLSLAAINGPEQSVVSGTVEAVDAAVDAAKRAGFRARKLGAKRGFHSAATKPMLGGFRDVLLGLQLRKPSSACVFVSALTGRVETERLADPEYWVSHVREPVRFSDACMTAATLGMSTVVECGPHPVLCSLGALQPAATGSRSPSWISSSKKGEEPQSYLLAAGTLRPS